MIKNYFSLLLLVFVTAFSGLYAQDAPVLVFSPQPQNNVKYNRFLLNPAFSFVREDNRYVSLYHRNQWVQYDDSPKVYMLAYSGKFTDKAGFGFGMYQQTVGVINSWGGIANYAYNVKIKQKFDLTFGFNVAYYNSGINKNRAITAEPDPLIMAMRNNSLVSINPGVNLEYKQFDFGLYAENMINYDFKSADMAKEYTNKSFSGHLMYTHQMVAMKDLFQDSEFRLMLRGRNSELYGFGLGGSLLVNFPRIGWVQAGTDDYYGIAIGMGFHFTKKLSLGYTYERITKDGLVNLGPTHEITMVFCLKDRDVARKELLEEKAKKPKDTLAEIEKAAALKDTVADKEEALSVKDSIASKKTDKKTNPEFDNQAEIEKLKMDLDPESMHLLESLIKEDSLAKIKKAEFDKKVKNLKEYAKREKAAKENAGENKPVELKNIRQSKRVANPQTLEDLKHAEDGYYVVSKDAKAKDSDKAVDIEKHKSFTEAANASEKKKASGKKKGVYIVHVDNNPNPELEEQIETKEKPNTLQNAKDLPKETDDPLAHTEDDVKGETLKTEEEIKEFYSDKTSKPRETIKKVNRASVEGMDAGYYIIANVYSSKENVDKFINKMSERDIKAGVFLSPKNNMWYVYLKKHATWREALISYYSNVDNTYFESIWIMSINN
ncbi:PorP/SprF family type IX secretion system membrane protein [Flavobacterium hauense]